MEEREGEAGRLLVVSPAPARCSSGLRVASFLSLQKQLRMGDVTTGIVQYNRHVSESRIMIRMEELKELSNSVVALLAQTRG